MGEVWGSGEVCCNNMCLYQLLNAGEKDLTLHFGVALFEADTAFSALYLYPCLC